MTNSQDYVVVEKVETDGAIPVTIFENKITGLKVAVAYVESPIVKLDLTFATEAFDDDGLPHTLEHLVFMGSESYPYKGVLDLLASRCLSVGTNAYTDTDHTNYTLATAGSDGSLNLLPIYLEHLLFPTLTDSAYTTEVHHINAEGENAGVVYCEMQARENTGEERCYMEMLRSMYPGKCGYKSNTGGLLENLRTSTSNEKVRNYHKEFYHSKNLCVIVTGPVDPIDVFTAIKPVEDKIVSKGMHLVSFDKPWQTPVEPLVESVRRRIKYPCDTDDEGLVEIAFRGPKVINNFRELVAISVLLDYLNSTAVSPIQRDFVECEEPYCSSVDYSIIENSTACFNLSFESVGKEYLDLVADKFFKLLAKIATGEEAFDDDRMATVISRKIVRILSAAETSPHSIVVGPIIGHFLYGAKDLRERCQEIPILQELTKQEASFWTSLLDKYMVGPSARHVCIVGEPSPELMRQMSTTEKERVSKQKTDLKDSLPELAEKLKLSIESNEKPAPESMLNSVPIPSLDNIKFHSIERAVLDEALLPFRFQYDSIKTNFITIAVLMNTSNVLEKDERLYLTLLSDIILECAIERDGVVVPYEKIVAELFRDTIHYDVCLGVGASSGIGTFSSLFTICIQVEIDKYERAVKWIHELLFKTVFTAERIKTVATKNVSDITQLKRSGSKVASAAISGLLFQSNSNLWASNFMRRQKFLRKLIKDLKQNPEAVSKRLTSIRDKLTKPNGMFVHLSLNKDKLDVTKVHEPWLKLIPNEILASSPKSHLQFCEVTPCHKLVQLMDGPKAAIVGVGSVETNYMNQMTKSVDSWNHPDVAAIYVLLQYLTQIEGPLWRQLRGLGLTYSYSITLVPSQGLISFLLYKASQLVEAYAKTVEIVDKYLDGEEAFEDGLFESAKSSLIFDFIRREKSPADKSFQSLLAYLRNQDIDFNKDLIKRVAAVTKDDLMRVGTKYLRPLFQDPERRSAICCHPSKVDEIIKAFQASNCELQKINLEEAPFLNAIE